MRFENFLAENDKIETFETFAFLDGYIPVAKNASGYVLIHQSLIDNTIYDMTSHVITDYNHGDLVFMFHSSVNETHLLFATNEPDELDTTSIDRFIELLNIPAPTDEQLYKLMNAEINDDTE